MARLEVTRQIATKVQENYSAFIGGMRQVQAVDLDLARAGVQVRAVGYVRRSCLVSACFYPITTLRSGYMDHSI